MPPIWGCEEKSSRYYSLARAKAAFADPARLNRTMTAAEGAQELGMDGQVVSAVITDLTEAHFREVDDVA